MYLLHIKIKVLITYKELDIAGDLELFVAR